MLTNAEIINLIRKSDEFKVGDVLIGKPGSPYVRTTHNAVVEVTDVFDNNEMVVKIIYHDEIPDYVDQDEFDVNQKWFEHYTENVFGLDIFSHEKLLAGETI